jgi:hypothetical protein
MDAIHPNLINLTKLNFNAKFPDECAKNLRVFNIFEKLQGFR